MAEVQPVRLASPVGEGPLSLLTVGQGSLSTELVKEAHQSLLAALRVFLYFFCADRYEGWRLPFVFHRNLAALLKVESSVDHQGTEGFSLVCGSFKFWLMLILMAKAISMLRASHSSAVIVDLSGTGMSAMSLVRVALKPCMSKHLACLAMFCLVG